MPGKVNPVIPEAVNQVAFAIMGNDLALTVAADGTIYIASGDAIYRSDDRGATFTVFQEL